MKPFLLFTIASLTSLFAQATPPNITCQSQSGPGFTLINQGNPRNGATAHFEKITGPNLYGGVWLKLIGRDNKALRATLTLRFIYQTMNGSTLAITQEKFDPWSSPNCGRGSCPPGSMNIRAKTQAQLIGPNGQTVFYENCN